MAPTLPTLAEVAETSATSPAGEPLSPSGVATGWTANAPVGSGRAQALTLSLTLSLSSSVLIDGLRRLAKALLEDWPSMPYFRLTMPEAAVCCSGYAPSLAHAAARHGCGYSLIQTTLCLVGTSWIWQADDTTPLLRVCPQCGEPLPCRV